MFRSEKPQLDLSMLPPDIAVSSSALGSGHGHPLQRPCRPGCSAQEPLPLPSSKVPAAERFSAWTAASPQAITRPPEA